MVRLHSFGGARVCHPRHYAQPFLYRRLQEVADMLILPRPVFQNLCESVGDVVLRDPGNLLLIKPHPKQDLALLKHQFARWDAKRWMLSSFQTTQLAGRSDFVICMVSGVILDALAVGKPTVEFFQYAAGSDYFPKDDHGRTQSMYRLLGLAVPADTRDELAGRVEDYFSEISRSGAWDKQQATAAAFMRLDNRGAGRAVDAMETMLDPR